MILSKVSIHRRSTVFIFVLAVVIFGIYAYVTLPREAAPDVEIPYVFVTTTDVGVAPEDVESSITVPIESKLKGISDVKEIRSVSQEGMSLISVEFFPSLKIEDALQKVRDKVDQAKPDLPEDADEPAISELNIADLPIMLFNVSGEVGLVHLKQIADDLKDRIEAINGVLSADVVGGLEREIRVELDPDRLASYQIPLVDLLALVKNENTNVSGGTMDIATGKYQVRVPGQFTDPLELASLSIKGNGSSPIYLVDVGRIVDTHKDRTSYARFNGQETVTIVVRKRIGENIVRIADDIKALLARQQQSFPPGVSASITLDRSTFIRSTVEDLQNNILTAVLFVVAVIMVSMNVRNALFVAIAIPLSMLITFGTLSLMGVTLNMVVLFSLVLCLGMLVDNAVVMVENMYRHMQEGEPRIEAAIAGSAEVAWPVITSTLTTVGAFVPLMFWPGMMGRFMWFLPLTVNIALMASLLVALVVNPPLCSKLMKVRVTRTAGLAGERQWHPILRGYAALLRGSLQHPVLSILAPLLVLVLVVGAYAIYGRGVEFFPEVEPRSAQVNIRAPEGTNLDATNEMTRQVEAVVETLPDVKYRVANVGSGGGSFFGPGSSGPNVATVSIEFVDRRDRKQNSRKTIEQLRNKLKDFVGADIEVDIEKMGPPTGKPVNIEISGEDFQVLAALSHKVKQLVRDVPGMVDLKDDFVQTRPELQFRVDRDRATLLGLNTRYVADFIKMAVQGTQVDTFWENNEEYDITLRLAEPYRSDPVKIGELLIPDPRGNRVPLSSIAQPRLGSGLGAINRIDQNRVITVSSNVAEGYLPDSVLRVVRERLKDSPLPRGYNISFTGESEDKQEAQRFLLGAFAAAFLLVLLIIVAQFNSITVPLIIMSTVVLSLAGALLGLIVTRTPFGIIMTGIGVISLAGVVVNNGIVLIDYIEKLLTRGRDVETALVEAGAMRLRPVFLTAISTILGVVPIVIGMSIDMKAIPHALTSAAHVIPQLGEAVTSVMLKIGVDPTVHRPIFDFGAESTQWWRPMAVAVAFGLGFATILTLVIVPNMYLVAYRLRKRFGQEKSSTGKASAG